MESNKKLSECTFRSLGINDDLCNVCKELGWSIPTAIQSEAIPIALRGLDVIALAETGSGKTGAFALPILQTLIQKPQKLYALILTPTRELAVQIKEQFDALGKDVSLRCCTIVGGMDTSLQTYELSKYPHVIVGTPGRLVYHIEQKTFKMPSLKFLVMDEADRILNLGFEEEVDKIMKHLPQNRQTLLFSATMTSKVKKLHRAHLKNPVRVEVSSKFQTVNKLQQKMIFIPFDLKNLYLVHILKKIGQESVIVFCSTCFSTLKIALMLRALKFTAIPIHSKMSQNKRLGSIDKFKKGVRSILVGTDVISRGLDIPDVDYVINYDIPNKSKDYIHRVGRTARAGKAGTAITFVTQYEVEVFQRLEHVLGKKLDEYPVNKNEIISLKDQVAEAERETKR
ncbi:UNVERIFIED_CONTAM: hypothetical protein RMT77_008295 [Armadillidium vulgare]